MVVSHLYCSRSGRTRVQAAAESDDGSVDSGVEIKMLQAASVAYSTYVLGDSYYCPALTMNYGS